MLVESFVNNIIIDLSYSLNKYTQYKLVQKLFDVCWYRLHRNEKLLKIFVYPSNNRVFYGLELNL